MGYTIIIIILIITCLVDNSITIKKTLQLYLSIRFLLKDIFTNIIFTAKLCHELFTGEFTYLFSVMFCRSSFVFLLVIALLFVPLQFAASDYPFGSILSCNC
jgi:hypothetical protein